MKENAEKKTENRSHIFDNQSKMSEQTPICDVLQAYTGYQSVISSAELPKKTNNTGLPDALKSGVENLSGYSMDDVRVHYNSDKPAQFSALAYAQGADIHLSPGQEKHLPHEAWHVVQQMQGRVQPTMQMKGININDSEELENEADVLSNKVRPISGNDKYFPERCRSSSNLVLQRVPFRGTDVKKSTSIKELKTIFEYNPILRFSKTIRDLLKNDKDVAGKLYTELKDVEVKEEDEDFMEDLLDLLKGAAGIEDEKKEEEEEEKEEEKANFLPLYETTDLSPQLSKEEIEKIECDLLKVKLITPHNSFAVSEEPTLFGYSQFPTEIGDYILVGVHQTPIKNVVCICTYGPLSKMVGKGSGSGKGRGFYVTPIVKNEDFHKKVNQLLYNGVFLAVYIAKEAYKAISSVQKLEGELVIPEDLFFAVKLFRLKDQVNIDKMKLSDNDKDKMNVIIKCLEELWLKDSPVIFE